MEIESNSNPDDPRPWFDGDLRSDLRAEINDINGLSAAEWTTASDETETSLVEESAHSLTISEEKPMETHVLAITTDGDVELVPESDQRASYYAHLAWYDPETDEIEALTFRDSS